jgi:hypothetical protein
MKAFSSFEYINVFTALLSDVQTLHSDVFTHSHLEGAKKFALDRYEQEGLGFLTKTLPSLGKCFDQALALVRPLEASSVRLSSRVGEKIPEFLRELFLVVLKEDGTVRHRSHLDGGLPPVTVSAIVQSIRQLLYAFYKLELPYDPKLKQEVVNSFVKTEDELRETNAIFQELADRFGNCNQPLRGVKPVWVENTIRGAIRRLSEVFNRFDPWDIAPGHGPGAVSTKERLWHKFRFTNIPQRLRDQYPIDAYFMASTGHVCDEWKSLADIQEEERPAQVILVPKDSRGPRLISEEPLENQWIQQGLFKAMIARIEHHPLTRDNVRFTDQEPNRNAALIGSLPYNYYLESPEGPTDMELHGRYATLDLKEASDRVSLGLVRLLFPQGLVRAMESCRSLGTKLPDGTYIELIKFAPMGSALCFPVLALTVWSVLSAGLEALNVPRQVIDKVYVYGDDVIVNAAYAEHAMIILETFGLKINRVKSCTKGLFRESCGMDAYNGCPVTPVRFKRTWSSSRRPDSYTAWIAYANSMWDRKYYAAYDYIVSHLLDLYGPIPETSLRIGVPSLHSVPQHARPKRRVNPALQRVEYYVWASMPKKSVKEIDGWLMLLF